MSRSDGKYQIPTRFGKMLHASRAQELGGGGSAGSSSASPVLFANDQFVLTAVTPVTLILTYLPIVKSPHVELNGLGQQEGVDYTIDGPTITLLTAVAAIDDLVDVRYAYLTDVPVEPEEFVESATFEYTGATQFWVVPYDLTATVELWGAQGGGGAGGLGGYVETVLAFTEGESIAVEVGENPTNQSGGYNGGGYAGDWSADGKGGGGASDVRRTPYALADRLATAGGGGGQGNGGAIGGAGGADTGGTGGPGVGSSLGGEGGTQVAGGAPGSDDWGGEGFGTAGALGVGGLGNDHAGGAGLGPGGGGGGFYGGGGGSGQATGGGGGSNHTTGTVVANEQGVRAGHGRVVITW